jgi:Raf kinase inhibitor-like YbhB/YbcL family protein
MVQQSRAMHQLRSICASLAAAMLSAMWLGCTTASGSASVARFELSSPAFREGDRLPDSTMLDALDCHGPNRSPALEWRNAPVGTKSFVLILDDFEARGGDGFIHWVVYNIPATVTNLPEDAGAAEPDLAGGGRHAYNDFLKRRYGGPCPPEGPPHKYRFTLYAVDMPAIDDAGTPMTWRKLRFIIHDHTFGRASLTTLRGH